MTSTTPAAAPAATPATHADLCICGAPRHYHREGTGVCMTDLRCVAFAPIGAAR